ncbi:ABC-type transport auxiliary lipoprotein family protein [Marinobacter salicampi]|uniref:ABC-type transport auxiliary lipoprotein family protein n=1 Tax=Marinobacter salicampi TaxID=435907 RepID=UPI001409A9FC|nr:ABC-type transport auxiliary lipoprotein family protein [Marinobacter salicampi]
MTVCHNLRAFLMLIGVAVLFSTLTACTILPEGEPVRAFLLPHEPLEERPGAAPLSQSLAIGTPRAGHILDSRRIAVVQDSEITSYRGARWADLAPTLLRDRLIEAFQHVGQGSSVSSADANLYADLQLDSRLRAFQSEYVDGTPTVLIRLDAQLVDNNTQRILASRSFEVRKPSPDETIESVVATFGRASDDLSGEVVDWLLEQAGARD